MTYFGCLLKTQEEHRCFI